MTSESKIELKKSYGIAGRTKVWRILQREISKVRTDFHPDGLDKYWKDEDKRYNEDSFRFIRDIETFMKEDFKTKLEQAYGSQWFKRGVPKAVYDKANQLASEKNYEITDASEEYSPWDCLTLIDYRRIATYGSNWRDIFEKYLDKHINGAYEITNFLAYDDSGRGQYTVVVYRDQEKKKKIDTCLLYTSDAADD